MTSKNLHNKKKSAYIYTEADLGEGILDEGVNLTDFATKNQNGTVNNSGYSYPSNEVESKNYGLEIVNVEDDFNYSYYL